MDGKGGLGMSHFDAMRLTIPQALYYLSDGERKIKRITPDESQRIVSEMSERDRQKIKDEINRRIAYYSGRG